MKKIYFNVYIQQTPISYLSTSDCVSFYDYLLSFFFSFFGKVNLEFWALTMEHAPAATQLVKSRREPSTGGRLVTNDYNMVWI